MTTYLEYKLENGSTFLVQIDGPEGGMVKAAMRGNEGNTIILEADKAFSEALESVKGQAAALQQKLAELRADEVEVKFGLKAIGKAGNFAVGKVGAEANYEVTLKWKHEPQTAHAASHRG